jgi:hypothetical protein
MSSTAAFYIMCCAILRRTERFASVWKAPVKSRGFFFSGDRYFLPNPTPEGRITLPQTGTLVAPIGQSWLTLHTGSRGGNCPKTAFRGQNLSKS